MRIPPAGKTIPAAQPLQMFRVTADWVGGGFAYTLSFPDAIAARAWGMQKARGRGQVSVEPRGLAIGAAGAKAMQGSMAAITLELNGGPMPSGDAAELALLSYQLADAMLKARSA